MVIIKYDKEEDAQRIIDEQLAKGLQLVEVSNISEGNFLGFDDRAIQSPTLPPTKDEQIAILQQDNLIIMDALASVYEQLLIMQNGGTV